MFKRALRTMVMVAGIGLAGVASATPITFTDVVNPADVFFNNGGNTPYSFVHDIRDDGFNPLTDTLTSLSITLRFRDDSDRPPESVNITFDNANSDLFSIRSGSCVCYPSQTFQQLSTSLMQKDGLLNILLGRKVGDFWFMDSTLVAQADRGPAQPSGGEVPEPAAGLLTGLALVGVGLIRRRKTPA